jgi:hypothetical protein
MNEHLCPETRSIQLPSHRFSFGQRLDNITLDALLLTVKASGMTAPRAARAKAQKFIPLTRCARRKKKG